MQLDELFEICRNNVFPEPLKDFAGSLDVTPESLVKIGIGYLPEKRAWVFPERNHSGQIIGLIYRLRDGKKIMAKGSHRGLTYVLNPDYMQGEERYEPGQHNWIRVSEGLSCPICGKSDWCLVSDNSNSPAAAICPRIKEGSNKEIIGSGYLHIRHRVEQNVAGSSFLHGSTSQPILVVEGQTDVAAAMDLGFVAVGRPSAQGKIDLLTSTLYGKQVIVVGENDKAGIKGMNTAAYALHNVCKTVTTVLPPEDCKDLRIWKKTHGLTQEDFLNWVDVTGLTPDIDNLFKSTAPTEIAKGFIKRFYTQNDLLIIRNFRGQWVRYEGGHYKDFPADILRSEVYNYLDGKQAEKIMVSGIVIIDYEATRNKVNDIIDAMAAQCVAINAPPSWFDTKPHPDPRDIIIFKNGYIGIYSKTLQTPTPNLFSFTGIPHRLNKVIQCPQWIKFLDQIFDQDRERIELLQEWFGYHLTADMSFEKMMLFVGRPCSGKGTVLEALTAMLGAEQVVSTSFANLSGSFGYEPLVGKLSAQLPDAHMPVRVDGNLALERIKHIVGRDPVGVNKKFARVVPMVYLSCRFTIAVNELPRLPDNTGALRRRLNLLYFANSYENCIDRTLKSRLAKEAAGIMNWALVGLHRLRENDSFILPKSSLPIISDLQRLITPVRAFVEECCDFGENFNTTSLQFWDCWKAWTKDRGMPTGLHCQLGQRLLSLFPQVEPHRIAVGGRQEKVYLGINLQDWAIDKYLERPR